MGVGRWRVEGFLKRSWDLGQQKGRGSSKAGTQNTSGEGENLPKVLSFSLFFFFFMRNTLYSHT